MSTSSPDTKEKFSSQIPALKLLKVVGFNYLTPCDAIEERHESTANVLLYSILRKSLRDLPSNQIHLDGKLISPPEDMLNEAIRYIDNYIHDNIIFNNRELYRKLTMGESFRGTVEGRSVQKHIRFFEFNEPLKNQFHITEEFSVLRSGIDKHYRPDVVVFINGIPVVIVECKRRGKGQVERGVGDHLKKQAEDGIKRLYVYSQILVSICGNKAMYGALGAKINFWNKWKEDNENSPEKAEELRKICALQPDEDFKKAVFSWRSEDDKVEMQKQWDNTLEPTEQDRLIFNLLRPERLIREIGSFIVFEGDSKVIARHQQFFGIESALKKIKEVDSDGVRRGGLFWHTTGSGKSVTMVMLAKAILDSPDYKDPRIVLVTDRVDLDKNIYDCFLDCGVEVYKIPRGKAEDTAKKISNRNYKVLSAVIDRLENPQNTYNALDESNETFIFVDEAHRTHSEDSHKRAVMKAIFPKASIIGFTGTPISKKNNDTVKLFGGWIHKYTMDAALEDKAVCKIIYSNKNCPLEGDDQSLDRWFERRTRELSREAQTNLRKVFKSQDEVLKASTRRSEIAYDIAEHFKSTYRVSEEKIGLKGLFATSSKYEALKYMELLEKFGISCNLVMSPPGEQEGEVTVRESEKKEIEKYWRDVVDTKYGGKDNFNIQVTENFKKKHDPEVLIVVDMLLTGFNNQRCAVLYTDKTLKEHKVLQAIARVNRPFPGKEYGEVIDYRNIIGDVTSAILFYRKLEAQGYQRDEIDKVLFDVDDEIKDLDSVLKNLWDTFPENSDNFNRMDQTMMVRHLMSKETYGAFILAFKKFHYKYKMARGHFSWLQRTDKENQERLQKDYKYFVCIRAEAEDELGDNDGITYAELVDDIRRFVEDKISADPPIVKLSKVDLFSNEYKERNKKRKERSQADSIRVRLNRFFEENWDDDPILAQQITEIINQTYNKYKNKLDQDVAYFEAMTEIKKKVEEGSIIHYPAGVEKSPELKAYYSVFKHSNIEISDEDYLEAVNKVKEIIKKHSSRDWTTKKTIVDSMEKELLEELVWPLTEKYLIKLTEESELQLLSSIIGIAKSHQGR